MLGKIRAGERVDHFETERMAKDGSKRYISLTVSPIRDISGRIVGASKIARDISARLEAEEAVRASTELKDQFLSLVSHELRTPISVILGNGYILLNRRETLDAADRHQAIVDITFEAERLQRIIENLLLLTRVEAGERLSLTSSTSNGSLNGQSKPSSPGARARHHQGIAMDTPLLFGDATLVEWCSKTSLAMRIIQPRGRGGPRGDPAEPNRFAEVPC